MLAGAPRAWPFGALAPFSYDLAMVDPPWPTKMRSPKGEYKSAAAHYGMMSFEEIAALPVGELVGDHAVLFLWGTWPMILHGGDPDRHYIGADAARSRVGECIKAWGARYVTGGAWFKRTITGKPAFGPGYRARSTCEPFLLATFGNPHTPGWAADAQHRRVDRGERVRRTAARALAQAGRSLRLVRAVHAAGAARRIVLAPIASGLGHLGLRGRQVRPGGDEVRRMTTLRQRFVMHARLAKGGYLYGHEILDGEEVVGTRTVRAESRSGLRKAEGSGMSELLCMLMCFFFRRSPAALIHMSRLSHRDCRDSHAREEKRSLKTASVDNFEDSARCKSARVSR